MKNLTPANLKTILFSKRANIYYLEKCRVMQKDGRILYLKERKNENEYYNIPIANTTTIMLGTGTSITQAAVRMLAAAGVMVGFVGDGGTPLLAGTEIEWLSPQSEYRPTKYVQGWLSFWFAEEKRLTVAKRFSSARMDFLEKTWKKDKELAAYGFYSDDSDVEAALSIFRRKIKDITTVTELLAAEAQFAKRLYKYAATNTDFDGFTRDTAGKDEANKFLNHGNYLAYGMAASVLWVLGIPHGLAVMHGKTRRGALVFDVADLIKDAIVLPWSFICAQEGYKESEFRTHILQKFTEFSALDFMYDVVKQESQCPVGDDSHDGTFC